MTSLLISMVLIYAHLAIGYANIPSFSAIRSSSMNNQTRISHHSLDWFPRNHRMDSNDGRVSLTSPSQEPKFLPSEMKFNVDFVENPEQFDAGQRFFMPYNHYSSSKSEKSLEQTQSDSKRTLDPGLITKWSIPIESPEDFDSRRIPKFKPQTSNLAGNGVKFDDDSETNNSSRSDTLAHSSIPQRGFSVSESIHGVTESPAPLVGNLADAKQRLKQAKTELEKNLAIHDSLVDLLARSKLAEEYRRAPSLGNSRHNLLPITGGLFTVPQTNDILRGRIPQNNKVSHPKRYRPYAVGLRGNIKKLASREDTSAEKSSSFSPNNGGANLRAVQDPVGQEVDQNLPDSEGFRWRNVDGRDAVHKQSEVTELFKKPDQGQLSTQNSVDKPKSTVYSSPIYSSSIILDKPSLVSERPLRKKSKPNWDASDAVGASTPLTFLYDNENELDELDWLSGARLSNLYPPVNKNPSIDYLPLTRNKFEFSDLQQSHSPQSGWDLASPSDGIQADMRSPFNSYHMDQNSGNENEAYLNRGHRYHKNQILSAKRHFRPIVSSSNTKAIARHRDHYNRDASEHSHKIIHIHTKEKKDKSKYLWPILGGGLTMLMGFLIISNMLLSIPLLAIGASSLFNHGGFHSQQLVPVYNLSQLVPPRATGKRKRRRRRREAISASDEQTVHLLDIKEKRSSVYGAGKAVDVVPEFNELLRRVMARLIDDRNRCKFNGVG